MYGTDGACCYMCSEHEGLIGMIIFRPTIGEAGIHEGQPKCLLFADVSASPVPVIGKGMWGQSRRGSVKLEGYTHFPTQAKGLSQFSNAGSKEAQWW